MNFETLMPWSPPKRVNTSVGERILRKAPILEGDKFWDAWRNDKETLKKAGISCGKDKQTDAWEDLWWQPIPQDEQVKRKEALVASRATDADIEIPCPPGLNFLPYQKAGIVFALKALGFDFSKHFNDDGSWKGTNKNANRTICENAGNESQNASQSRQGPFAGESSKSNENVPENSQGPGMAGTGVKVGNGGNAQAGNPRAPHGGVANSSQGSRVELLGRERAGSPGTDSGVRQNTGTERVHQGIPSQDQRPSNKPQGGELLQGGLRKSTDQNSNRTGRAETQSTQAACGGQKEDGSSGITGLESVSDTSWKGGSPSRGVLIADEMGL